MTNSNGNFLIKFYFVSDVVIKLSLNISMALEPHNKQEGQAFLFY
ncbi:MAG TPA: hypothetical protein VF047_10540 [Nitrososphaeraceae archaeon]